MVQTAKHLCTFEEYLVYHHDLDQRYELVNGELVPIPPATDRHGKIGRFLFKQFESEIERLNLPLVACYGDVGVITAKYQ